MLQKLPREWLLPQVDIVHFTYDFKLVNFVLVAALLVDEVLTMGVELIVTPLLALDLEPGLGDLCDDLWPSSTVPSDKMANLNMVERRLDS
jgi:hypothetical protein